RMETTQMNYELKITTLMALSHKRREYFDNWFIRDPERLRRPAVLGGPHRERQRRGDRIPAAAGRGLLTHDGRPRPARRVPASGSLLHLRAGDLLVREPVGGRGILGRLDALTVHCERDEQAMRDPAPSRGYGHGVIARRHVCAYRDGEIRRAGAAC